MTMNKVVVLDGGFASQLCTHVGDVVDGNPLWSAKFLASHPQAVTQTHLDFLRDLEKPLIVGSVGPYGASLHDYSEYTGDYVEKVSQQEIADWHRPRIQALLEAGVDLLALETIPAQAEGEALAELIKEFPECRAWISFSCKDEHHTSHGENFQEAARCCWERNPTQLVAIGANCLNPKFVTPLITGINDGTSSPVPLVVYPNSGETFDPERGWVDGDNCVPVDSYVREWLNLGVTYIGGCCRTYARDVCRIRSEVKKWIRERNCCKLSGRA
ncbi:homocysteine S-methyltransferase YbgG isoform X2 [Anabrus simplex]|uniref:homocysteine S-methyltransferase YbgG isoform X2 n=1 Tax=Anabrus simplex TaxID=316456 RepID=UPI0034DDC349